MNTRIRKLRKTLDLTQSEFAEKIGSTANVLTHYETGRRNPSRSVINNICKTFHVSEEWLREGTGEMFVDVLKDDQIMEFVQKTLATRPDSFQRRFAAMLSALSDSDWELLERMANTIINEREAPGTGQAQDSAPIKIHVAARDGRWIETEIDPNIELPKSTGGIPINLPERK